MSVEQEARELLAAEYPEGVRAGTIMVPVYKALAAITAALRSSASRDEVLEEAAKELETRVAEFHAAARRQGKRAGSLASGFLEAAKVIRNLIRPEGERGGS